MFYASFNDVPAVMWKWKYFTPAEIACRGTGKLLVDEEAMNALQKARELMGKPFVINSAYRSPEHNKRIGGAPLSRHVKGQAFDIATRRNGKLLFDRKELFQACLKAGFRGFGFYENFLHVDTRPLKKDGSITTWINGAPWQELENM